MTLLWVLPFQQSIVNADKNMKPADIYVSVGDLKDANINRSPTAYEANPAKERDM